LLIGAELGQDELEIALLFVAVDLGQELGLGPAGAGGVAFGGGHRDVFEVDFGGQHPAGPIGELDSQGAAQDARCHVAVGNGGEAETRSGGAVDPGTEPPVSVPEPEAAEQGVAGAGHVEELLGDAGGLVDRFDDDPFVVGPAEGLAFDDLAGEAVSDQVPGPFGWPAASDYQLHQLAGTHP
jgi:hypothetical protein